MTPNFTNINYILNTLYEFKEKKFAFDFSESLREPGDETFLYSPSEHIKSQVEIFDSLFELAEGEINHNIFAGNVKIINSLFQYIKSHRDYIYPKPEFLLGQIQSWNAESYEEYENKVNERSTNYFANDKFKGLKHLDKFDDFVPSDIFRMTDFKHVKRTYYAFYCIEEELKEYFDLNHFEQYQKFLIVQINKLVALFDKYIVRYDAGEFTNNNEVLSIAIEKEVNEADEKTLYDKKVKKAKNNPVIVFLWILGALIAFVAVTWKSIKDFFPSQPDKQTIILLKDSLNKKTDSLKTISGIIFDEQKRPIKGVCIELRGVNICSDTTDSFGRFFLSELKGKGWITEKIIISRIGYLDSVLSVKVNYTSDEPLHFEEIILKKRSGKTDQQLCEEGDIEACWRFANSIVKTCPTNEGQARTACIFKAEMWRAVGDDYKDVLIAKRDSGVSSLAYKEAKRSWLHQIEMANAMPDF